MFEIIEKDGLFEYRLKAKNGEILIRSLRYYETKESCEEAIEMVKKYSQKDKMYLRLYSSTGNPYFILKAPNGDIIGKSQDYMTFAARENGISSVKKNALWNI